MREALDPTQRFEAKKIGSLKIPIGEGDAPACVEYLENRSMKMDSS